MHMHKSVIETLVGAIVLSLCVIFVFVVYRSGNIDEHYKVTYLLKAAFERADGIGIGSDVNISGVNVGKVIGKELDPNNYYAIISMRVDSRVQLSADTSAEITSVSLLGDKYLALIPGADSEMLQNGDMIEFTQSSISLEGLIGKLMFGLGSSQSKDDDISEIEAKGTQGSEKDNMAEVSAHVIGANNQKNEKQSTK
jgi:phospholipid/cholesterol/gamma-HCH transport system substrate-binding protein